ncbi:MAG: putative ATPase, partial [Arenicella sp.]
MEINISNLGTIKKGKLELGKLTILGGKNNSGKTYVAYTIYGFIKFWQENIGVLSLLKEAEALYESGYIELKPNDLHKHINKYIKLLSEIYSEELYNVFNVSANTFSKTTLQFHSDKYAFDSLFANKTKVNSKLHVTIKRKEESDSFTITLLNELGDSYKMSVIEFIKKIIASTFFTEALGSVRIITSERTGIQMFQKELDINKNQLVEKLIKMGRNDKKSNPFDLIEEETARYSLPIRDNINQVRDLPEAYKQTSFLV